jgi:serine protease Do
MAGRIVGFLAFCALIFLSSHTAQAERRVALVIGNGAYQHTTRLPNPANDAREVAAALKRVGFETFVGLDLNRDGMEDATIRFARLARTADVAIFYYSGHAMQFGGVNYLMPVDAKLADEADLRRMSRLDEIVGDLQQAKNLRILVLDACRDNPLAEQLKRSIGRTRAVSIGRGLAKIDSPQGMIVAYATQSGQVAEDGRGSNSPFTSAFLKHIETPEEIGRIFRRITADVYETTKRTQLPELSLSLIGDFYLKTPPQPAAPPVVSAPPPVAPSPPKVLASRPPAGSDDARAIHDLTQRVSDAVVNVTATRPAGQPAKDNVALPNFPPGSAFEEFFKDFFCKDKGKDCDPKKEAAKRQAEQKDAAKPATSQGSGFVVDASGLIATAQFVVDKADRIEVNFKDGTKLTAQVVGSDPKTQMALLKVTPHKTLTAIKFGNSDELLIGNRVVAIGNSMGLGWTVTSGMISALHRNLNAGPYDDYIQTDAGAAKGYAGAPLLALNGDAVGVMTSIFAPKNSTSANMAFAIPSNMASAVLDQLRRFGETQRSWLGVRIQAVTKEIADSLNVPQAGALVAGVDDRGPAKAGGLAQGDVIVKFDGKDIKEMRDLPRMVADTPVGKEVEVAIIRKGKQEARSVRLGRLEEKPKPASIEQKPAAATNGSVAKVALGLDLAALDGALRSRHAVKQNLKGVFITAVKPDSTAAKRNMRANEIIVEFAGKSVADPDQVDRQIDALRKQGRKSALILLTKPDGQSRFVALPLP